MTCTQTDGPQTLVLDPSCRVLRIAHLFMGYTQSFIHLLNYKNYIFLFPTAGFQCLGLGVMRHFLPSPKSGTEAQHWNPGALEPSVGLQNLVNYPQDKLLSITKCQHRTVSLHFLTGTDVRSRFHGNFPFLAGQPHFARSTFHFGRSSPQSGMSNKPLVRSRTHFDPFCWVKSQVKWLNLHFVSGFRRLQSLEILSFDDQIPSFHGFFSHFYMKIHPHHVSCGC